MKKRSLSKAFMIASAVALLVVMAPMGGPSSSASTVASASSADVLAVTVAPATRGAGQVAAVPPAKLRVRPDSHSGCNGNICIDVYGSGLVVAGWDTYAHLGSNACGYAYFFVNGTRIARSTYCYRGKTPKVYLPGLPHTYSNGTVLCNEWLPGGSGYPC